MRYAVDDFITNMKKPERKEFLRNTHMKHTTSVKKDKEQKQLEVPIRQLRKPLQEEEEESTKVKVNYKNWQKIHESTKK